MWCRRSVLQNLSSLKVSKQAVMSSCVAGVALRDISPSFKTCQTSFCVAGALVVRRFQKMRYIFRGRRSTLETPMSFCVAGAALSTCRVACLLESLCQGCATW